MGEEVIAVVQPADMAEATDELRDDIMAYAREKLSGVKVPRRIDFLEALPRRYHGQLYKPTLGDPYWDKEQGEGICNPAATSAEETAGRHEVGETIKTR